MNTKKRIFGWLAPDGTWLPCEEDELFDIDLLPVDSNVLLSEGYINVFVYNDHQYWYGLSDPNDYQRNVLSEFGVDPDLSSWKVYWQSGKFHSDFSSVF